MQQEEISIFPEREIVYGTFWQRFAAALIDTIILSIPNYILQSIMNTGNEFEELFIYHHFTSAMATYQLLTSAMSWLYYALMESGRSQATIGKQALRLRVTDTTGGRISFGQATGRYFGKFISTIILLIGYLMMIWDNRKQTLHDKMAGTLVIRKTAEAYA